MQQDDEDNEVTSSSVIAATSTLQQQQVGIEVDAAQQTASDKLPTMSDLTQASLKLSKFQNLFKGCVFWVSREVPRNALELLIKSFGGELAWDDEAHLGEEAATTEATQDTRKNKRRGGANSSRSFHCAVSPYKVSDARITHHLVDRPLPQDGSRPSWMSQYSETTREYLQPQWVFDCINAQKLLKTTLYQPGQVLPPHLSPFVKYEEGDYVPEDAKRMFGISAVGVAKEHEEEQQEADNDVEDVEEEEEEEDADADDVKIGEQDTCCLKL